MACDQPAKAAATAEGVARPSENGGNGVDDKGNKRASEPRRRNGVNSEPGTPGGQNTEKDPSEGDGGRYGDGYEEPEGEAGEDGEGEGDGDGDGDADDDVQWEELYACPLEVRFTQEKIHPFFYRRGPIVNVVPKIRPVLTPQEDADAGCPVELVPPFGTIHCLRKGDELWSLDNRRLYALQLAAMEQWPQQCRTRIMASDRLPRRKLKTQWRKFQTTNEGRAVTVCARYQQFDTWSWFDRAVELEWYTLSQRLSNLMNAFEMIPVIGALLFRTGLTGFATRTPLIVAFILSFSLDLIRQRVPVFERSVCELHVKAVMDGDIKQMDCCGRKGDGAANGDVDTSVSAPQLAAMMGLVLIMVLPYILGIPRDKLRSSLFSCWLGVACVLFFQLVSCVRANKAVAFEYTGANQKLTPKHRGDRAEKDD